MTKRELGNFMFQCAINFDRGSSCIFPVVISIISCGLTSKPSVDTFVTLIAVSS